MSIIYDEIKSEVLNNLDLDATDTEAETKYQILASANAAQRSILRKVPVSQVDNILQTVTGKLLEDIPYYAWPSDFIRFYQLWISYGSAISEINLGLPVTQMEGGNFVVNNLDKAPSSYNPKFFFVDGGWEIRPKPTADQDDGYQLQYVYSPPDISATQPSLLRDDLRNALIFKTSELAGLKGGNRVQHSEKYGSLFIAEIAGFWQNEHSKKAERA